MHVEQRKIGDIKPYERNPRVNDDAVDAVARSIEEFGFRQPIVVDTEGVIVCGHTRWKAAQKLGLETVPVHVATDLTPEQIRAYRIADNRLAERATWDMELLPIELSELQGMDMDLGLLGFSEDDLAVLLEPDVKDGQTDPNAVPEPPDEAISKLGEVYQLGDHRLMCGDSCSVEDLDLLLGGAPIHLVNTDPPYNVKVEPRSNNAIAAGLSSFSNTHHQGLDLARHPEKAHATTKKLRPKDRPLENDFVSDEEFDRLLLAWFGNIARVLAPGRGFYIWGGYANVGNYPPVLKACGLYFSQSIIWDKQHPVLTRKDFMGAHEWCQPPETMVLTPNGEVPICELKNGDQVVSFARRSSAIVGYRNGPRIAVNSREYTGDMYSVCVGGRTTHATDGHIFSAKLPPDAESIWCVYLMRKGNWWRVGKTQLLTTWGLGIKGRLDMEGGHEAWVLSVHRDGSDATCAEQVVSVRYGIPTTFWNEKQASRRTGEQIKGIYDQLDAHGMHRCAMWALNDHGRKLEYPFVTKGKTREKYGRRVSFKVRACNLVPGAMLIPVPLPERPKFEWMPIDGVASRPYSGPVYSMNVEKYHHYIADGIVTHNCFYGWREGAAHKFYGPNNATDLWHVKKVNPQSMIHLTEKPVELAVRAIQYSSAKGENVLDLFGGSGSTLIACEQTGRHAFLMELDELYCDVIRQRWAEFVHGEGCDWQALTSPTEALAR